MEVSGQLNVPVALPSRNDPRYPLNRVVGGPQSWAGHSGGEEKNSCPCREWNPGCPAFPVIAVDADKFCISCHVLILYTLSGL